MNKASLMSLNELYLYRKVKEFEGKRRMLLNEVRVHCDVMGSHDGGLSSRISLHFVKLAPFSGESKSAYLMIL